MSADNEICILESGKDKKEWRVIHAQAFPEQLYYWEVPGTDEKVYKHNQPCPKRLAEHFCDAEILETEEAADKMAEQMVDEIEASGGYVEYGINTVKYKDDFPIDVDVMRKRFAEYAEFLADKAVSDMSFRASIVAKSDRLSAMIAEEIHKTKSAT